MELVWMTDELFNVFKEEVTSGVSLDDRRVSRRRQGGSGEWG